jgi:arylsulfatase A-like enzyme
VPTVFVENGRVAGLDPSDPIEVSYQKPFPGDPDLTSPAERAKLCMDWTHGHNQALVNGVGRIGWMKGGKAAVWVDETLGDTFCDKACAFIERSKDKPFFLYYAAHECHVPRIPNPRFIGTTPLGARGDAVVAFDEQCGRILATLDKLGLTGETLVIMTSDNGPVLDDGYADRAVALNAKADHRPAGPFRGGKYSILEGGTRVSLIARWPGRTPVGKISDALVSQVDFAATLTKVAGGDPADFLAQDGVDVSAALAGGAGRDHIISHTQAGQLSYRDERWKFIPGLGRKRAKSPAIVDRSEQNDAIENADAANDRLFDLRVDPGETKNVIAEHPEVAERLRALLAAQRKKGFGQPLEL